MAIVRVLMVVSESVGINWRPYSVSPIVSILLTSSTA